VGRSITEHCGAAARERGLGGGTAVCATGQNGGPIRRAKGKKKLSPCWTKREKLTKGGNGRWGGSREGGNLSSSDDASIQKKHGSTGRGGGPRVQERKKIAPGLIRKLTPRAGKKKKRNNTPVGFGGGGFTAAGGRKGWEEDYAFPSPKNQPVTSRSMQKGPVETVATKKSDIFCPKREMKKAPPRKKKAVARVGGQKKGFQVFDTKKKKTTHKKKKGLEAGRKQQMVVWLYSGWGGFGGGVFFPATPK